MFWNTRGKAIPSRFSIHSFISGEAETGSCFIFLCNNQSQNLCLLGGSHLKSQNYLWQEASSLMGINFKQTNTQTSLHVKSNSNPLKDQNNLLLYH